MRRLERRKLTILPAAVVLLFASFLGGCESDSPTSPSQGPAPPPPSNGGASVGWTITVRANPADLDVDEIAETGNNTSTITVTARRNDNNQPPPVGATTVVSTSVGTLTDAAGTVIGSSIPVSFNSAGQAVAVLALPAEEATAIVRAQIEQSFGQATVRVAQGEGGGPLFIESITPNSGPPAGGTVVRIDGTGFEEPVRVSFGTLLATVLSVSPSRITVQTPAIDLPVGEVQAVAVSVTTNVNDPDNPSATDTVPNAFTYARGGQTEIPSIISITPTSGPNEGGTQVTIFGEGFADDVQVFFGISALIEAPVLSVSPTRLVVETPSATGPNSINQNSIVGVRVINTESGLFADITNAFQYGGPGSPVIFISAAGPGEGIYLGGTNVTVFGQGFDEPVALEFGGFAQQVISVTGTEIVGRSVRVEIMNCNRPSGPFGVTNIETGESASSGITFTYLPVEPVIINIDPASVMYNVDSDTSSPPTVTITGVGFDRVSIPPRVVFGEAVAPGVIADPNDLDESYDPRFGITKTLTVDVPPFVGDFDTEECPLPGGGTGTQLASTQVSLQVINLDTGCTDMVENFFTYVPTGPGAECQGDDDDGGGGGGLVADFEPAAINGLTVEFMDTSTGDPTSWLWEFDDSSTSMAQNPSHDYAAPGTYNVTLTVEDDLANSSSTTMEVAISP